MLGKLLTASSVFLLFVVISIGHSSALPAQNIGISPAITTKSLNPGSVVDGTLNISNNGLQGYTYYVYASPYGVESTTYQPVFKKLPGYTDITSWVTFSTVSGYLKSGQSYPLNYKITVPSKTPPGSYYVAMFAQTGASSNQNINKTQVNFEQRVGSLFYININGQAYENGNVDSWTVPFFQSSKISGTLKLKNTGKLYYVTTVNANFEDLLGNVKYQYQTQKIVIPEAIRAIQIVWPKPPALGIYKVNGTATVYGQKYLTSRYVLIVSPAMRLVFIFMVVAIIMYLSIHNAVVNILRGKGDKK